MRRSLIGLVICHQKLTAPNCTIIAVTCAIERHADDSFSQSMLCHARRDMRMMMLNTEGWKVFPLGAFQCISCCQIIRVHVVGNRRRFHTEQTLEMLHALLKGFQRLIIFHIPDVMTEKGIISVRDTERVFQFGTGCKQGWNLERKFDREGGIAAGTTDGISNW